MTLVCLAIPLLPLLASLAAGLGGRWLRGRSHAVTLPAVAVSQGRDWRVLQTEHVDIYHYAPDSTLILYLAPLVEETFGEFSETFRVEFRRRLPLVFYATHYDFQQTNMLPMLISEYTGGFTDLIRHITKAGCTRSRCANRKEAGA